MSKKRHQRRQVVTGTGSVRRSEKPTLPETGGSVLELVMVVALFGTLTAIALALVLQTYKGVQLQLISSTLFDSGAAALNQMTKELRVAGYPSAKVFSSSAVANSPGLVATAYVSVTPYDLVFQSDADGNGAVAQIEYVLASGSQNLYRKSTLKNLDGTLAMSTQTTLLVNQVQNQVQGTPLFSWEVDPSNPQPFPLNVRAIFINLVLASGGGESGVPATLTLTATCPRMNF